MIEEYKQARQMYLQGKEEGRAEIKSQRDRNYEQYQESLKVYRAGVTKSNDDEVALKRVDQREQTEADLKCGKIYTIAREILEEEGEEDDGRYPLRAIYHRILEPKIKERSGGIYPSEVHKMHVATREITIASTMETVEIAGAVNQRSRHGKPRVFINPVHTKFRLEARPSDGTIYEDTEDDGIKRSPANIVDAHQFLQIVEVFRDTPGRQ